MPNELTESESYPFGPGRIIVCALLGVRFSCTPAHRKFLLWAEMVGSLCSPGVAKTHDSFHGSSLVMEKLVQHM